MAAAIKNKNLQTLIDELVAMTASCRPDMHEPDEQNLYGHVVGDGLDNACVPTLKYVQEMPGAKLDGAEARLTKDWLRYQDLALVLERQVGEDADMKLEPVMVVNLCDLIAAVRMLDAQVKAIQADAIQA